ncbi:MAG TPA: hypothetical protein VGE07_31735, partial [Herpetosiphonaceae bacterium]
MLLLPALLAAGWWLARKRGARLAPGPTILRALLLALLLLALANPVRGGSATLAPLIILADQSASVPAEQRAQTWAEAQELARRLGPQRPVRLIAFGADASVALTDQQPAINPEGSDLAGALGLAGGLLPDGGQVV